MKETRATTLNGHKEQRPPQTPPTPDNDSAHAARQTETEKRADNTPARTPRTDGTEHARETRTKYHWGKTAASFLLVLLTMPIGHALMIVMERAMPAPAMHRAAFAMGAAGLLLAAAGVFVRGDTRQTLCGFLGALLFWTGWVEFLFQYYARRYGVQPEMEGGVVVTQPEYLILPATFGLWMMVMTLYVFSTKNGCKFINWWQKVLFRDRKDTVAAQPMTRHTSIVTFMEFNMIIWACYLLLMVCYDKHILGDRHPVTSAVAAGCLAAAILMFRRQLRVGAWGPNIRMAIATVIVFWTPVEVLGRINFFNEIWTQPEKYMTQMALLLAAFLALLVYIARKTSTQQ